MSIAPNTISEKSMPAWTFVLVVLEVSGASWAVSCRPPGGFWGFVGFSNAPKLVSK